MNNADKVMALKFQGSTFFGVTLFSVINNNPNFFLGHAFAPLRET